MAKTGFFLRSGETWRSPWDDYRALRNDSPILFVPAEGDNVDCWVLSRFADVFAAVRDTATFSSAQGLTPNADAMSMFEDGQQPIVMMDPPDHTVMRRLVSRQMTPRRVARIEHAVREFVDRRLDGVADAGQQPVDIVAALFKPLPSFVVAHYLGVPQAIAIGSTVGPMPSCRRTRSVRSRRRWMLRLHCSLMRLSSWTGKRSNQERIS